MNDSNSRDCRNRCYHPQYSCSDNIIPPRSVRESVATVWRQATREAKNTDLQVHTESGVPGSVQLYGALGEDSRMLAGHYGDGFRQHRSQRADRPHPARRYVELAVVLLLCPNATGSLFPQNRMQAKTVRAHPKRNTGRT